MEDLVRVGITHGDINGVGYEVIVKALDDNSITELFTPIIFAYPDLLEQAKEQLQLNDLSFHVITTASEAKPGKVNVLPLPSPQPELKPSLIDGKAGESAVEALELAVDALKNNDIDVLVTAPISKEAVQSESFNFPGHTEFLQARFGDTSEGNEALMILCNDKIRVALQTVHVPISKVAESISTENIIKVARNFSDTLKMDFGLSRPTIAILSLNPHAGDGGILGTEESEFIQPAIDELKKQGIMAFGPFPSDGFFGHGSYKKFDGILAMYHDQGLAPFKTIASNSGVNFTAGLPIVRTSPDHGTAFDIAWKGVAEGNSMREAIYTAIDIFRRRNRYQEASANPLKKHVVEKPDRSERGAAPFIRNNDKAENDD